MLSHRYSSVAFRPISRILVVGVADVPWEAICNNKRR